MLKLFFKDVLCGLSVLSVVALIFYVADKGIGIENFVGIVSIIAACWFFGWGIRKSMAFKNDASKD